MRATSLLRLLLDQEHTIVRGFQIDEGGLTIDVTPSTRVPCCSGCTAKVPRGYDARVRTWRHLDFAGMRVWLRYRLHRVDCPRCGVTSELVPWADPGSWFTRDFEDTVGLLAQRMDKTSIRELMGIAWQTVGAVALRVFNRRGARDLLDGLNRIGIDEISYKKRHHYLTVVTDHDRKRVVWVGVGRKAETLGKFFGDLGAERTSQIKLISIDMSASYIDGMRKHAPDAEVVFDRFHVQKLANVALDEVRRAEARTQHDPADAKALKNTRWALLKRPWNLTLSQRQRLSVVQGTNKTLYRAYLLKETLSLILDGRQVGVARTRLREWINWARRSRLKPFVRVANTLSKHEDGVLRYVSTRLTNAFAEGINSKVRTATKQAYGFRDPSSLIGMIFLRCSGLAIPAVRHTPARAVKQLAAAAHPLNV